MQLDESSNEPLDRAWKRMSTPPSTASRARFYHITIPRSHVGRHIYSTRRSIPSGNYWSDMPDPITIISGFSAIGGIVVTTGQLSIQLYRIAKDVGSARREVEEFAMNVQTFSSVMSFAHNTLEQQSQRGGSISDLQEYLNGYQVTETLSAQSSRLSTRIEQAMPQMSSLRSRFDWMCRIRWVMQKPTVQALQLEMESVKSSMTLIVCVVGLRMLSVDQSAEKERLKVEIKAVKRTLTSLQYRMSEQSAELVEVREGMFIIQDALIRLAESVTRKGTIPQPPRRARRRENRRGGVHGPRAPTATPPNVASIPKIVVSSATDSVPPIQENPGRPSDSLPGPTVSFQLDPHPNDANRSSSSRPQEPVQDGDETAVFRGKNEERTANANESLDYSDVRPMSYLLHLDGSDRVQSITGYVNNKSVTALVDEELNTNLISQAFALKCDIQVEPLDESIGEAETTFDFGRGRLEPKIGNASFKWNDGHRKSRSFTVHCSVCRHDIRPIILGHPFVTKRTRYRRPNG